MSGLNLPQRCGVMTLRDCTLFPQGGLPLHIFEARYRQMLSEALAGDCIFAIARVRDDGKSEEVAQIGTAGLIRASREHEDGTSEVLLHGVIRVRFLEWMTDSPYPCARIEPILPETIEGAKGEAAMKTLRGAVEDAIAHLPEDTREAILALVDQAPEPGLMSDLVAQQFVLDPDLRQKLLETTSVGERISLLCGFFDAIRRGHES